MSPSFPHILGDVAIPIRDLTSSHTVFPFPPGLSEITVEKSDSRTNYISAASLSLSSVTQICRSRIYLMLSRLVPRSVFLSHVLTDYNRRFVRSSGGVARSGHLYPESRMAVRALQAQNHTERESEFCLIQPESHEAASSLSFKVKQMFLAMKPFL